MQVAGRLSHFPYVYALKYTFLNHNIYKLSLLNSDYMNHVKKWGAGIAMGTLMAAAAALSPLIQSDTHTFTVSGDGQNCSIAKDGQRSLASIVLDSMRGSASEEGHENVVRLSRFSDERDEFYFGTGYRVGPVALTAAHVAQDNHGLERFIARSQGEIYSAVVLGADPEADIALVGMNGFPNNGPGSIKIGDVRNGDPVTVKTLDTKDWAHANGSASHRTLNWVRYAPDSQVQAAEKQIVALEREMEQLQAKLVRLDRERAALSAPYYPKAGSVALATISDGSTTTDPNSQHTAINPEPRGDRYFYTGKEESDWMAHGVSGSALFNRSNQMAGIAVTLRKVEEGLEGVETREVRRDLEALRNRYVGVAVGINPGTPETVVEQLDALFEQRSIVVGLISDLEAKIFRLTIPPQTDGAVSPQAIVSFLKGYCGPRGAGALQHLGNSKAYNKFLRHGFTEPPKTLYLRGMKR